MNLEKTSSPSPRPRRRQLGLYRRRESSLVLSGGTRVGVRLHGVETVAVRDGVYVIVGGHSGFDSAGGPSEVTTA